METEEPKLRDVPCGVYAAIPIAVGTETPPILVYE